jgi:hypothetical protein
MSKEFEPMVSKSVSDIHGLGLLVLNDTQVQVEGLRTLAMIHQNIWLDGDASLNVPRTEYEYVFVVGVPKKRGTREELELHTFGTMEGRKKLAYFEQFDHPIKPTGCSIFGHIRFSKYQFGSLLPAEAVTRKFDARTKAVVDIDSAEKYVQEQGWTGGLWDQMPRLLHAMIEGKFGS